MKDFLFLGSDVSLFHHSIELYAHYLPTVGDYEFNSSQSKCDDLMELLNSGFNNHEFRFPVEFAPLVLEALSYYNGLCLDRYRKKIKEQRDDRYFSLHLRVATLIGQINLMLDLNDDD